MLSLNRTEGQGIVVGPGGVFLDRIHGDWVKLQVWNMGPPEKMGYTLTPMRLEKDGALKLYPIGPDIKVAITNWQQNSLSIGIGAPRTVPITRIELLTPNQLIAQVPEPYWPKVGPEE